MMTGSINQRTLTLPVRTCWPSILALRRTELQQSPGARPCTGVLASLVRARASMAAGFW